MKISDKEWQARMDAETLSQYAEIMSDSKRKNAALKAASKKATELQSKASALRALGGKIKRPKK